MRKSKRIRGLEPEYNGLPRRRFISNVQAQHFHLGQGSYNVRRSKWNTMDEISSEDISSQEISSEEISTDEVSTDEDNKGDDGPCIEHFDTLVGGPKRVQSITSAIHSDSYSKEKIIVLSLFCIILLLIILFLTFYGKADSKVYGIGSLPDLFPSQHSILWETAAYGKSNKLPFVLLLVHNQHDETATCLAKCIAKTLAVARRGASVHPVLVEGRHTHFRNDFLDTLKTHMQESHALVLLHVDHVSSWVAEKLHYVVDLYTPWIPEGVFVLTMELPKLQPEEKLLSAVEKALKDKWSNMTDDSFGPLVIRVADTAILVQEDSNVCPSSCEDVITLK